MKAFVYRRGEVLEAILPKGTELYYFQADPEGRMVSKTEHPPTDKYKEIDVDDVIAAEFLGRVDEMYASATEDDAAFRKAVVKAGVLFGPYMEGLGNTSEILQTSA